MAGLSGICNHEQAANMVYLMLLAMQHLGEATAHIVSSDKDELRAEGGNGLIEKVFSEEKIQKELSGVHAIGYNSQIKDDRRSFVGKMYGGFSICMVGRIKNAFKLRAHLENRGALFQSDSDSELLAHLIAQSKEVDFFMGLHSAFGRVEGAYAFLALNNGRLYAGRDKLGYWSLHIGKLQGSYVVSTETCAFSLIDATYEGEVLPGQIVVISNGPQAIQKLTQTVFASEPRRAGCLMDVIYNARPDSVVFGRTVAVARHDIGAQLYREYPVAADLVLPLLDSTKEIAVGFHWESKIPLGVGLIRNHYIWHSLSDPKNYRDIKRRIKFNPTRELLAGKRVALIINSILRGERAEYLIALLKSSEVGAREVHLLSGCPFPLDACEHGGYSPPKSELLSSRVTIDMLGQHFKNADSVGVISLEGLLKAIVDKGNEFCVSCLSGKPTEF